MTWWHVLLEERYSIQGEERKIRMYERDTKIGEFKVLVIGRLCHGVSLLTEIYSFIFLEKRIYIILDSLQHFFINEEQSREGNRNWLYRRKKILSIFFWNILKFFGNKNNTAMYLVKCVKQIFKPILIQFNTLKNLLPGYRDKKESKCFTF